jgi:hypothetical protein
MTQTALAKEISQICVSHIQVDLTNENADRVSRDLFGLELGEVGGSFLRSPVSMQANTAAKSKIVFFSKMLYILRVTYAPTYGTVGSWTKYL